MARPLQTNRLVRALLACGSGLVVAASFWPLPAAALTAPALLLAGLAVLVLLLDSTGSPRGGFGLGFAFGLGMMALLVEWLRVLGIDAWLLVATASALFYAGFGWAYVRLRHLPAALVWVTAAWVAMEFARTQVPLGGFPWGRLVFAVEETTVVHATRWIGVAATSGLLFATAWCLARIVRGSGASLVLPAAALIVTFGLTALLPVGLAEPDRTITVAAVQGDVPGTGAESLGERHAVTENHARATDELAQAVEAGEVPPPDLVVWPENSTDIDPFANPDIAATISTAVDTIGRPTLVGVILDGPEEGQAQNAALVWQPGTGPAEDRYVKRHLVPFGEYVPFRDLVARFVDRLDQIPRDMVPGGGSGVLSTGPAVVGTMLCFDVSYDDIVRDDVLDGAELLVVQTNNATYHGTVQPEQQWAISRVRAVETGRDLVVASVNGISGMVAADGSVLQRTHERDRQSLVQEVSLAGGVTWGVRVGPFVEWAAAAATLIALIASVLLGRRRHRADGDPAPPALVPAGRSR